MKATALVLLLASLLACKESEQASERTKTPPARNVMDDEVKRALVLDAAIKKLEDEIAALETSGSADPALLAQKKDALKALRSTLANTQRRIELRTGSGARVHE